MSDNLFGRARLGYVLVESLRVDAWNRFAVEGLGLHVDTTAEGGLSMRVDDRVRRLIVKQGPAEDVVALGWELDDEDALSAALARLRALGIEVYLHTGPAAALRGVEKFWSCIGPKRTAIELFTHALRSDQPLRSKSSGYLTGAGGLGHVAITSREPEAMRRFWQHLFDARVSDRIEDRISGTQLDFTFLRINERHHSIAIASTRGLRVDPQRTSIHHLNFEVAAFEDVVNGYLRCRRLGYPIASAIGQHPNDKDFSFYVMTPSGFEIELGWNPVVVTEEAEQNWTPQLYQGISLWGHFPENLTSIISTRRKLRALWSLTRPEYTVGKTT
jgi:2,3-dihydroxybiphenyl 1,2-dioxygenase